MSLGALMFGRLFQSPLGHLFFCRSHAGIWEIPPPLQEPEASADPPAAAGGILETHRLCLPNDVELQKIFWIVVHREQPQSSSTRLVRPSPRLLFFDNPGSFAQQHFTMSLSCRYAAQCCARQLRSAPTLRTSAGALAQQRIARRYQSTEAAAAPTNPKIAGIVDQISQLTLLETADLVSSLKVGGHPALRMEA